MIKILLNITLILVTFFACYLEDIYLLFWSPQPHKTLPIAIRAQQAFSYDQEKALSAKRKKALDRYIPVFTYIPQRVETAKKKLTSLKTELALYKAVKGDGAANLAAFLKTQFGVNLSKPDVIRLIKYRDLNNLIAGIVTIQDSILQKNILETDLYLKGKKSIEIHNPAPMKARCMRLKILPLWKKRAYPFRRRSDSFSGRLITAFWILLYKYRYPRWCRT